MSYEPATVAGVGDIVLLESRPSRRAGEFQRRLDLVLSARPDRYRVAGLLPYVYLSTCSVIVLKLIGL